MHLLELAKSKGVELVQGKASSLFVDNGRATKIKVDCGDGMTLTLTCDKVVIAAGPGLGLYRIFSFRNVSP
jgi:pyruvate/2-oxoglutarate dehydrogenase complex dihydrolipoamide dehydrogenase (E3) component